MLLFFNMSGGEIILIMFVFLLFFGSKNIPEIARSLGKGIRQFKDATQEIQRDIENSTRDVRTRVREETRLIRDQFEQAGENPPPPQITPPVPLDQQIDSEYSEPYQVSNHATTEMDQNQESGKKNSDFSNDTPKI